MKISEFITRLLESSDIDDFINQVHERDGLDHTGGRYEYERVAGKIVIYLDNEEYIFSPEDFQALQDRLGGDPIFTDVTSSSAAGAGDDDEDSSFSRRAAAKYLELRISGRNPADAKILAAQFISNRFGVHFSPVQVDTHATEMYLARAVKSQGPAAGSPPAGAV